MILFMDFCFRKYGITHSKYTLNVLDIQAELQTLRMTLPIMMPVEHMG
jgi:hypothetical protein